MFPLELFPYASLSSSVTTTVWVGVVVIAIFNLRLGWVLSGLVVPGYLVPLLIVKPWSATVIIIESMVVYVIVYFVSESLSSLNRWSSLFGRDRFLALVVVSVLVRLVFDVTLIPMAGEWLNDNYNLGFDYRNQLQVFGLVIVSLMANQYWKTGLLRGVFVLGVTLGITWLIVRYGLMELTNFSIGSLRFMYEDLAASLLASPKAYIILLTTAFVCSRLNLRYGWDFNGILLPSLLALQWFAPYKILASFVEAFIILIVARALLTLDFFKRINMEGARLLLLFFNVSFAYKMALGYLVPIVSPGLKVSDTYGFGYLLATLLAIKMHEKKIVARVSRVTIQASGLAIVLASALGFSLTFIGPLLNTVDERFQSVGAVADIEISGSLEEVLLSEKVSLYAAYTQSTPTRPTAVEHNNIHNGFRALKRYVEDNQYNNFASAASLLASAGMNLRRLGGGYLLVTDRTPSRGWGMFLINTKQDAQLHFQVPYSLTDASAIISGLVMFSRLGGKTLAVSGLPPLTERESEFDPLFDTLSIYHLFHMVFARRDIVQLLPVDQQQRERELDGAQERSPQTAPAAQMDSSLVSVIGDLPEKLDLRFLKLVIGAYDLRWGDDIRVNVQRDTSLDTFVSVQLSAQAKMRLIGLSDRAQQGLIRYSAPASASPLTLLGQRYDAARTENGFATAREFAPSMSELLYLDREIITPIVDVVSNEVTDSGVTSEGIDRLRVVALSADALGYELVVDNANETSQLRHLVLTEDGDHAMRGWGSAIFRARDRANYLISAPKPQSHVGSAEYAGYLYDRLNASVFVRGANEALAPADDSPTRDAVALTELVNQIVMRETGDQPLLAIMPRAMAFDAQESVNQEDAWLAFNDGEYRWPKIETPLVTRFIDVLKEDGLQLGLVDGDREKAGYEANWPKESRYIAATENKRLALLWLSPRVRYDHAYRGNSGPHSRAFEALGLRVAGGSMVSELKRRAVALTDDIPSGLVADIESYLRTRDIVTLRAIMHRWPDYALEYFVDDQSGRAFMLAADRGGGDREDHRPISVVVNLSRATSRGRQVMGSPADIVRLRKYVFHTNDVLLLGELP